MKPILVMTQPGKGGIGKTTIAATIADYYLQHDISIEMVDADDKSGAGLAHFHKQAKRISISKRDSLDALGHALGRSQIVLVDMPAAREEETKKWFHDVVASGLKDYAEFITICVISPDPGSIAPILDWANEIRGLSQYVLVKNEQEQPDCDWHFWLPKAASFLAATEAEVLDFKSINPDLQAALRVHGETLARVAGGSSVTDLGKLMWKIRAQSVWSNFVAQIEKSKILNP